MKQTDKQRSTEQVKSETETSSGAWSFDWDRHRYELDKLFFDDDGVLKR